MGAVPGDGLTDPPAVPEASSPPPRPEPATTDDIRSLRRWLLVAGVWAVAATAIAVIALVKANDANNDQENARTASQLTQVQRQLSSQLDDLEKRIGELAPAEDVSKLDNRLQKVENAANNTCDQVDALGKDLDDLQKRVDDLEQQAQSGTDTTGTDTTDTTP
jgi:peptidoglycan hydrolase CwlO-like protein